MANGNWGGVVMRLVVLGVIVGGAAMYMGTGSGEKEFQKTLDAMKKVHSLHATVESTPMQNMHNDKSWDFDCGRDLVHYQGHLVANGGDNPHDITEDQFTVHGHDFSMQVDGSWAPLKYDYSLRTAKAVCANLAQGTDTKMLPAIATMIKRGIIQKGDKKTVNGVQCREWLVAMKGGRTGMEHDTVCIGLDDHLPYELTVDWENSRSTFSDYNAPIPFEVPEAVLQPASATN